MLMTGQQRLAAIEQFRFRTDREGQMIINELLVGAARLVLKEEGQEVHPVKGKGKPMKHGQCFANAAKKTFEGHHHYAEGLVTDKMSGEQFAHGWNVDKKTGEHVDFTMPDPGKWHYTGMVVPEMTVRKIIFELDGYCILPHLLKE
jgi:hypothetical protein